MTQPNPQADQQPQAVERPTYVLVLDSDEWNAIAVMLARVPQTHGEMLFLRGLSQRFQALPQQPPAQPPAQPAADAGAPTQRLDSALPAEQLSPTNVGDSDAHEVRAQTPSGREVLRGRPRDGSPNGSHAPERTTA